MAIPFETAVKEDLNIGHGSATITNPAGGTLAGTKINMSAFLGLATLVFSATPDFDLVAGAFQRLTLTADVASSTISQSAGTLAAGTILVLEIIQDGTGGWIFNWPTNVLGAAAYPISTTALDRTLATLFYNGSNWMFLCSPTISQ